MPFRYLFLIMKGSRFCSNRKFQSKERSKQTKQTNQRKTGNTVVRWKKKHYNCGKEVTVQLTGLLRKETGKRTRRPEQEAWLDNNRKEQLEDKAMKTAAQYFGQDLLPYLGVKGKVRQVAPTEHIHLEARRLEDDFNFKMADGSYRHLEFESDQITDRDLRRFREYEAYLGMVCDAPVSTVVICTANVKKPKTELVNGENVYRVQVVCLKHKDGDRILKMLEKRRKKGKKLGQKRLTPLLLTPLMAGESTVEERICRSLDLIRCQEAGLEKEERQRMESILYAFAVKLLKGKALEKVKERFGMTLLGEMLVADGERKGLEKGLEKGLLEGRQEGRLEGRQEGETLKLISLIRKMTLREFQEDQIADLLGEERSVVRKICGILNREGYQVSDEDVYREYMR